MWPMGQKAKELADKNKPKAVAFINSIMKSSGESLQEANDIISEDDLEFLKKFLGWKEVGED